MTPEGQILDYLWRIAGYGTPCPIGYEALARVTGADTRRVARAIRRLRDAGILSYVRAGATRPNVYTLIAPG